MPGYDSTNSRLQFSTARLASASWPELAASTEELRHVPSHLSAYRQRIDAGVEEQRRQREILETLQDKILQCRLKNAHERGSDSLLPRPAAITSACYGSRACFRCRSCTELWDLDDHNECERGNMPRHREDDRGRPHTTESPRRRHRRRKSHVDSSDDASRWIAAPLHARLDASIATNEALSADVVQLSAQLQQQAVARQRETEIHAERLKHQKRSDEKLRNRLQEFWIECTTLKRKMNDLSEDVKADLAAQRPDFTRVCRVFLRLLQQTRAQDGELARLVESQQSQLDELQRQCIELNVANVRLRSDGDEARRRAARSEDALRRAADERRQLAACLKEICRAPTLFSMDATTKKKNDELNETTASLCSDALATVFEALRERSVSFDALQLKFAAESAKCATAKARLDDVQAALTAAQSARRAAEDNAHTLTLERDELKRKHTKLSQKLADSQRVYDDRLAAAEQRLELCKSEYEKRFADLGAEHARALEDRRREETVRNEESQLLADRARRDAERTVAERMSRLDAENLALRTTAERTQADAIEIQRNLDGANATLEELRAVYDAQRCEANVHLDELRAALETRNAQVDDWRQRHAAANEEAKARTIELASVRSELAAVETRLDDADSNLQEAILETARRTSEAESLRNALCAQAEAAEQKWTQLSQANETLAETLASREVRLEKDGEKIAALRKDIVELNKLYDAKSNELTNAVQSLHDTQLRERALYDRAGEAERQLTVLRRESQKLRDTVKRAEWTAKKSATDARLADEKCERLAGNLRTERELGRAEIDRLERLLDDELSRHLASSQRAEVADFDGTVETKKSQELIAFKLQYEAILEENKRLRQRLTVADGDLEAGRAESVLLRAEIDAMARSQRDALAELNAGRQAASMSQQEFVASLERELANVQTQLAGATLRETTLTERLTDAEARIERSAEMIRRLYAELEEISEQSDSQTANAESQLDRLRAELSTKSGQLDSWRQQYEQQREAVAQTESLLEAKNTLVREQSDRLNELEASLAESRDTVAEHRRLHDAACSRVAALENQCATLRRAVEENRNELQSRLDATLSELADEREKLRACEARLHKNEDDCTLFANEKSCLEQELSMSIREIEELNRNYRKLESNEKKLYAELNAEKEKRRELEKSLAEVHAASDILHVKLKRGGDEERKIAGLLDDLRETERQKFEALCELSDNRAQLDVLRNRLGTLTQSRDATMVKLRHSRRRVARLSAQLAANERSARRIAEYAANQEWALMPMAKLANTVVASDRSRHYLRSALGSSSDRPAPLFADELFSRISFMTRAAVPLAVLSDSAQAGGEGSGAPESTATTSLESEGALGARISPEPHVTPPPIFKNVVEGSGEYKSSRELAESLGQSHYAEKMKSDAVEGLSAVRNPTSSMVPAESVKLDSFGSDKKSYDLKQKDPKDPQITAPKRHILPKRRLRTSTASTTSSSSTSGSAEAARVSRANAATLDSSSFALSLEKSFLAMRRRIAALELEEARHLSEIRRLQLESQSESAKNDELRDRLSEARQNADRLREKNIDLEARLIDAHEAARTARAEIQNALVEERRAFSAQLAAATVERAADTTGREESARQHEADLRLADAERLELNATETRLRDKCTRLELKVSHTMDALEEARHELTTSSERTKQAEAELEQLRLKYDDLERRLTNANTQCAAQVNIESDDKAAQRRAGLKAAESSQKCALDAITARWRAAEQERDQIRRELLDTRSRLSTVTAKLNNAQAAGIEANAERRRLADRIEFFEKSKRHCETLKRELETMSAARNALIAEVDELKRQLQRANANVRELTVQLDRARREFSTQKSVADTLQEKKSRVEAAARQAGAERMALDGSLAAMERQNAELSRQCTRLQRQVEQMEHDGDNDRRPSVGAGAAEPNLRHKLERLEAEMHRLNQSKRQLEKKISQREQNHAQKLKMYELQVAALTERLEWEREQVRALKRAGASTRPLLRRSLLSDGLPVPPPSAAGPAVYSNGVSQPFGSAQRALPLNYR